MPLMVGVGLPLVANRERMVLRDSTEPATAGLPLATMPVTQTVAAAVLPIEWMVFCDMLLDKVAVLLSLMIPATHGFIPVAVLLELEER